MKHNYEQLIGLSRKKKRSKKEARTLYDSVDEIIDAVKENIDREKGLLFLYKLYEPLFVTSAERYHRMFNGSEEFDDILSEAKTLFLELLNRYKRRLNGYNMYFTYYIKIMLNGYLFAYMQRMARQMPIIKMTTSEYLEKTELQFLKKEFKENLREIYHKLMTNPDFRRPYYRKVFYLYFIEHRSLTYISKIIGYTPVRMWAVVKMLKAKLREELAIKGYDSTDYDILGVSNIMALDGG